MLHQSPTLSSARAAGHLMLLKLVRCMMIATTGVTIITQVNRLRPSHITFEDRARRTPMIESLRFHLAPMPKIDSVIRPLSAAASWCAASNGGADGSTRGRTPFEFARSSACMLAPYWWNPAYRRGGRRRVPRSDPSSLRHTRTRPTPLRHYPTSRSWPDGSRRALSTFTRRSG
jgi:hypothetical protein